MSSQVIQNASQASSVTPVEHQPAVVVPSSPSISGLVPPDDPPQRKHDRGTLEIALVKLKENFKNPTLAYAANVALTLEDRHGSPRTFCTKSARHAVYLTAALCGNCPQVPHESVRLTIVEFVKKLLDTRRELYELSSRNDPDTPVGQMDIDECKAIRHRLTMAYRRFLFSLGLNHRRVSSCMEQKIDGLIQDSKNDKEVIKYLNGIVCVGLFIILVVSTRMLRITLDTNQVSGRIEASLARIEEKFNLVQRDEAYPTSEQDERTDFSMRQNRLASLPSVHLPPIPEFFYGREDYVESIVDLIVRESDSRVAILGPGGIGKTSVALAVMRHPRITSTFKKGHYHWIPCENATSPEFLVALLAKSAKIPENSSDRLGDVVKTLKTSNQRHIFLFDSFDILPNIGGKYLQPTTILQRLALPNVSILVTTSGGTPPCFEIGWITPRLQPLSLDAARQTFLATYPKAKPDGRLDELLLALDCFPLAVNLMASVGNVGETPTRLLEIWKEKGPAMLNTAPGRLNSLNRSIYILLKSSHVQRNPESLKLLVILSMLPGGAHRDFIKLLAPSIKHTDRAVNSLILASLAYMKPGDTIIRVLSPIRSYMHHYFRLERSVREHIHKTYYSMAEPGNVVGGSQNVDAVWQLWSEQENMESVLLDALQYGDPRAAIRASLQYSRRLRAAKTPRTIVISKAIMTALDSKQFDLFTECFQLKGEMYPDGAGADFDAVLDRIRDWSSSGREILP